MIDMAVMIMNKAKEFCTDNIRTRWTSRVSMVLLVLVHLNPLIAAINEIGCF